MAKMSDSEILERLFPTGATSIGQFEEYEETLELLRTGHREELIKMILSDER